MRRDPVRAPSSDYGDSRDWQQRGPPGVLCDYPALHCPGSQDRAGGKVLRAPRLGVGCQPCTSVACLGPSDGSALAWQGGPPPGSPYPGLSGGLSFPLPGLWDHPRLGVPRLTQGPRASLAGPVHPGCVPAAPSAPRSGRAGGPPRRPQTASGSPLIKALCVSRAVGGRRARPPAGSRRAAASGQGRGVVPRLSCRPRAPSPGGRSAGGRRSGGQGARAGAKSRGAGRGRAGAAIGHGAGRGGRRGGGGAARAARAGQAGAAARGQVSAAAAGPSGAARRVSPRAEQRARRPRAMRRSSTDESTMPAQPVAAGARGRASRAAAPSSACTPAPAPRRPRRATKSPKGSKYVVFYLDCASSSSYDSALQHGARLPAGRQITSCSPSTCSSG